MRTLASLLLIAFAALPAQAQRQSPTAPADRAVARIDRHVDLTPEQRDALRAVAERQAAEQQSEREQLRLERRSEREQDQAELMAVLTPEQRAQLEARRAEQREERTARAVARLDRTLDLTDAQRADVYALMRSDRTMRQMQTDLRDLLTAEQAARLDVLRAERRERMRERRLQGRRDGARRPQRGER
jgi:Spy/CpxP family protein refolding chaperone